MKSLSLILRIVTIVAAAAAVALFLMSKGKLAEKQTALENAQAATQTVQTELGTANNQITAAQTQLSTERKSLADTKDKLEATRSEMYIAQQEVTRTRQQLKEIKSTITELEDAASHLRSNLVKTEETLASASKEAELSQLTERIEELAKANDTLKQDLMAAESQSRNTSSRKDSSAAAAAAAAARSQIAGFKPNMAPAAQPASIGTETTVASISTTDGIIVLNSTPELGFTAGSEITLIQDLTALGKVKITKVTEQLAIANILPGTKLKLVAGDSVKILR
ncbi:MAG: putative nucleic acid-binding Zn-ribbon protein [Lentimonas sp.]|jgi:predicted  nucleic acid-binding Zn-ribbon protein